MFRAAMCPSSGELLYQCDTWFMSLCVDDRLVCRSMMGTWLPETYRDRNKHTKKFVRQVGYLQGSYQDAQSTKHTTNTTLYIFTDKEN